MKKHNNPMKELLSDFDFNETNSVKIDLSKPIDLSRTTNELINDTKTSEMIFHSELISKNVHEITDPIDETTNELEKQTSDQSDDSKQLTIPLNLTIKKPVIKIIGIGGAGNNIVDFVATNVNLPGDISFYQLNTDYQHLQHLKSKFNQRMLIGSNITHGRGSGGDPECGRIATENFENDIRKILTGADVCIIIAGLGKGTGTGGSPVIGKIAKSMDILTLAFATMPSPAEGKTALNKALQGLKHLKESVDAITTISNEKILSKDQGSILEVYNKSNLEIGNAIKAITDIILLPAYQNIDLADVKNFFSVKNSVNFFVTIKSRFSVDNIRNINKIINQNLNQLVFEQSLTNTKAALILFYANSKSSSELYNNTTSAIKELSNNRDLNIVYGVVETNDSMVGFDIIALNSEPMVFSNSIITLTNPKTNKTMFSNSLNSKSLLNDHNLLTSRKQNRQMNLLNANPIISQTANKLEDDFNDLIETKRITTDQMSKILSQSAEAYFDHKSNTIATNFVDCDDWNLFKS